MHTQHSTARDVRPSVRLLEVKVKPQQRALSHLWESESLFCITDRMFTFVHERVIRKTKYLYHEDSFSKQKNM